MARRATTPPPIPGDGFPMPPRTWARVVKELRLSTTHRKIVELLLLCHQFKQIADILEMAPSTLKTHIERIYRRAGASDQTTLLIRIMAMSHQADDDPPCPT